VPPELGTTELDGCVEAGVTTAGVGDEGEAVVVSESVPGRLITVAYTGVTATKNRAIPERKKEIFFMFLL
jgi:hypothetical protein